MALNKLVKKLGEKGFFPNELPGLKAESYLSKKSLDYKVTFIPICPLYAEQFTKQRKNDSESRYFLGGFINNITETDLKNYFSDIGSGALGRYEYTYQFILGLERKDTLGKLRKILLANVGFELGGIKLIIHQIQGSKGKKKFLAQLKWERMLVDLVYNWAKQNGFKEVRIQSAESNDWEKIKNTSYGKMLYDITAERSGFKRKGDWYIKSC